MRMEKTEAALKEKDIEFQYTEEDGCASYDFIYRGIPYHIWEFAEGEERGAEANIFNSGRSEDIGGDYDATIAAEIDTWPYMLLEKMRDIR